MSWVNSEKYLMEWMTMHVKVQYNMYCSVFLIFEDLITWWASNNKAIKILWRSWDEVGFKECTEKVILEWCATCWSCIILSIRKI